MGLERRATESVVIGRVFGLLVAMDGALSLCRSWREDVGDLMHFAPGLPLAFAGDFEFVREEPRVCD